MFVNRSSNLTCFSRERPSLTCYDAVRVPEYNPPSGAKPLDLRSPLLKVKRAKQHISDLNAKRAAFIGSNTYTGAPKFNPETSRTQFVLRDVPAIDPEIRLVLGDVAHNLRTALDHLACELARSVEVADPRVYFPIFKNEEVYKAESPRKTKGLPKEAKDFIDRIGPYGGHDDLLWGLHELDRIDKHHLLLAITAKSSRVASPVISSALDMNLPIYIHYSAFSSALKTGDVIGEIEGNYEADKEMGVAADIAFGEPEVFRGEALFPKLDLLAERVEVVINLFVPNPRSGMLT